MKIAGIIAEYNPLHNGHAYHIRHVRQESGADYVVAVMSGSFVQRGEPAIADKWARAAWALEAGVDAVLELPTVFALSCAELFARGGVEILSRLGMLSHICFGSEVADIDILMRAAELLDDPPEEFTVSLKNHLALGMSYPRAQYAALGQLSLPEAMLTALSSPNGMLGIEYIRAIRKTGKPIRPVAIPRIGAGYGDAAFSGEFSSAQAIRETMRARGMKPILNAVPSYVFIGMNARVDGGMAPIWPENFSELVLYALRRLGPDNIADLPDVEEGLENIIYKASRAASSAEELFTLAKSKRYTMARLKRICMCALCGITKEDVDDALDGALYGRVLGFRKHAQPLIRAFKRYGTLPLVTRKADMDELDEKTRRILEIDINASDIHALGMPRIRLSGRDYTEKLIVF